MKTESTEVKTELDTELTEPITKTDTESDGVGFASDTELETVNTELNDFINESNAPSLTEVKQAADEKIEKITKDAAKALISQGTNGLLMMASTLSKTDLKISSVEIDSLADDIAPVVVKYGNDIGEAPPWLKAILKYRIELIALKGLLLFGVTVYMKFKEQKRLQLVAETEAKKAQANKVEPIAEAA